MAGRCAKGCRWLPQPQQQHPYRQPERSVLHVRPQYLSPSGLSILTMAVGCCLAHPRPVLGNHHLVDHQNLWPEDAALDNVSLVRRHSTIPQRLPLDRASVAMQHQPDLASTEHRVLPLANATVQHVFVATIAPAGFFKVEKQTMLSGATNSTTAPDPGSVTATSTMETAVATTLSSEVAAAARTTVAAAITTEAQAAAAAAAAAAARPSGGTASQGVTTGAITAKPVGALVTAPGTTTSPGNDTFSVNRADSTTDLRSTKPETLKIIGIVIAMIACFFLFIVYVIVLMNRSHNRSTLNYGTPRFHNPHYQPP